MSYENIDPNAVTKDELQDMAEAEGVDPSGTKAEIAERLEEVDMTKGFRRPPLEGFDSKNPGGVAFDYGDLTDEDRETRLASTGAGAAPADSEEAGGQGFGYGEVPPERHESGAY